MLYTNSWSISDFFFNLGLIFGRRKKPRCVDDLIKKFLIGKKVSWIVEAEDSIKKNKGAICKFQSSQYSIYDETNRDELKGFQRFK